MTQNNNTAPQPPGHSRLWIQPYKLVQPSSGAPLQARPRLIRQLDQCRHFPLTLLRSPAGYGKTSLLTQWMAEAGVNVMWYGLDPSDNDPSYFASHLVYGLHIATGEGCPDSLRLVETNQFDRLDSLLTKALIELSHHFEPLFIVLDDAHTLTEPAILSALRQWIRFLPPNIHLILTAHQEPNLGLSTLRVKGQLLELQAEQLAFNRNELDVFLRERLSFEPSVVAVDRLMEDTDGWPGGLELITRNARSEADLMYASGKLQQSFQHLEAYLEDEILSDLPETLHRFLTSICVFGQFDAELCNRLMDRADAETLIRQLREHQLFIVPADEERGYFRLQALFRQTLIKRMQSQEPERWREVRVRAGYAYLHQGRPMEAAQLALQLNDADLNLSILKTGGLDFYRSGQFSVLLRLLEPLDEERLMEHTDLILLKAWICLLSYQEDKVLPMLAQAESRLGRDQPQIGLEYAVARAQAAINGERFAEAKSLALEAVDALPANSFVSRTVAASVLGQAALCEGDLATALRCLEQAESLALQQGLTQQRLWSLCLMSDVRTVAGDLDAALDIQNQAIALARDHCIEQVLHMEFVYRNRAQILIERGQFEAALQSLELGTEIIEPLGDYGLLNPYVMRGRLALQAGDRHQAGQLAIQVRHLLDRYRYHTDWVAQAHEFLISADRLLGSPESRVFSPPPRATGPAINHFYQHYDRNRAMADWLNGRADAALAVAERLLDLAVEHGLSLLVLKARLLLAIWQPDDRGLRQWRAALTDLPRIRPVTTLSLYRQLFQVTGRDWPDWNLWFQPTDSSRPKTQLSEGDPRLKHLNQRHAQGHESVTVKEFQVLLLIGEGLSNEDIAQCMHVALSTVKSHIRRLYRKLDIDNRDQARTLVRMLQ